MSCCPYIFILFLIDSFEKEQVCVTEMGKKSKWITKFLTGKKDKEKSSENQQISTNYENPATPISVLPTNPKEKRRWSFRRSSASQTPQKDLSSVETAAVVAPVQSSLEPDNEQKKHAMALALATTAAADAAVAAAQAAAAMMRLAAATPGKATPVEEAAATKIQSVFRSYLVCILFLCLLWYHCYFCY